MIKYDVQCSDSHRFEGWFRDADTFDAQAEAGEIACPVCGDTKVGRALMAPAIGRSSEAKAARLQAEMKRMREMVGALKREVETHCEPVGDRFAEEARKIHYGETEARGIYGRTTAEEASSLRDEGISFGTLPDLPKEDA